MQPASMAAKTDSSCLLPAWPAGAARRCLESAEPVAERQAFGPRGRQPAIVNAEARFSQGEAGANHTGAERQRTGMREDLVFFPRRTVSNL